MFIVSNFKKRPRGHDINPPLVQVGALSNGTGNSSKTGFTPHRNAKLPYIKVSEIYVDPLGNI